MLRPGRKNSKSAGRIDPRLASAQSSAWCQRPAEALRRPPSSKRASWKAQECTVCPRRMCRDQATIHSAARVLYVRAPFKSAVLCTPPARDRRHVLAGAFPLDGRHGCAAGACRGHPPHKIRPIWGNVGKYWPISANIGRCGLKSARLWPSSADFVRVWAESVLHFLHISSAQHWGATSELPGITTGTFRDARRATFRKISGN